MAFKNLVPSLSSSGYSGTIAPMYFLLVQLMVNSGCGKYQMGLVKRFKVMALRLLVVWF